MASDVRQQLIDLVTALDIDYLLAPAKPTDLLVNLGTLSGIPNAELKNGALLTASGLLGGIAAVSLDGINDYVDLNWEPELISKNLTFFGLSNLLNEEGESQVVAWFSKFDGVIQDLDFRVMKGSIAEQGIIFPFGIALRILTGSEIESLFSILSEIVSMSWKNLGVIVDSTLTGVVAEAHRRTGAILEVVSTGVSGP